MPLLLFKDHQNIHTSKFLNSNLRDLIISLLSGISFQTIQGKNKCLKKMLPDSLHVSGSTENLSCRSGSIGHETERYDISVSSGSSYGGKTWALSRESYLTHGNKTQCVV